ncbi:MAG: hypothetical protein MUC97_01455 [Bernardetiaceae bacterium]|jgi:hypothetical protein|nr:hypothetical protein [Bernardetiaceae bacterium]
MNQPDLHVESARLQQEIERHLGVEGNLIYDFAQQDGKVRLDLVTVNRRHNQSFLFHTAWGVDRVDALTKMLDYVRHYQDREATYTIQWVPVGARELQTSYFRARHVYEALDKLYYGRELHSITVLSVVLNPVA